MSSAIYDVYSKVDDGYVVECDHEDLREMNCKMGRLLMVSRFCTECTNSF